MEPTIGIPQRFSDAYQRAGPLVGAADLLREFGVTPSDVTRGMDIDLDTITPDTRIGFRSCLELLERAATRTGCAWFGLLLGARYSWTSHGAIYCMASHAPTLRQALLDWVTWQLGYSSGAVVYLYRLGSDSVFGYGVYDRAFAGSRQLYELSVAVGCNVIQDLTAGQVTPTEIRFCHKPPEDLRPYREILKIPLRFNEPQCCLIIPGSAIDHPIPNADPAKRDRAIREVATVLGPSFESPSARLRHVIRPQLFKEDPSMKGAAKALGLTSRTLRRHLVEEGTTFEAIRDEIRFKAAQELLGLTNLPIGEISAALAFASHSAFAQAFRRWSGMSALNWRRQQDCAISN